MVRKRMGSQGNEWKIKTSECDWGASEEDKASS